MNRLTSFVVGLSFVLLWGCNPPALAPANTPTPDTPAAIPTVLSNTGRWEMIEQRDPITDRQFIGLGLRSETYVPRSGSRQAILLVRCDYGVGGDPTWMLAINWDDYLGSDNRGVVHRFGDAAPVRTLWNLAGDGSITTLPTWRNGQQVRAFLTTLQQANRLTARVDRYNDTTITATWDVRGLAVAVQPLLTKCQ